MRVRTSHSGSARRNAVFFFPAVNPYLAARFSALHEYGETDFECWFIARNEAGRDWEVADAAMRFNYTVLPSSPVHRVFRFLQLYISRRPKYIFTMHFPPALWLALIHRFLPGASLGFYIEKTWESWVPRTRIKELAKHLIIAQADSIFTPGEDATSYAKKYASPRAKYWYLPHVVDVQHWRRARSERPHGGPLRLLYLGRFVEEKGIRDLLKAIDLVDSDGDHRLEIDFVGSGTLRSALEEWSATTNVAARVHPFVQSEQLGPYLASADVLVFPTLGDPYGLVVDEAMAAGLAVIASSAAGEIHDRLTAGPSPRGIIYQVGHVQELANAIRALSKTNSLVTEMSASAAQYADENFVMQNWVTAVTKWCKPGKQVDAAETEYRREKSF